jgi:hypothetical protein
MKMNAREAAAAREELEDLREFAASPGWKRLRGHLETRLAERDAQLVDGRDLDSRGAVQELRGIVGHGARKGWLEQMIESRERALAERARTLVDETASDGDNFLIDATPS